MRETVWDRAPASCGPSAPARPSGGSGRRDPAADLARGPGGAFWTAAVLPPRWMEWIISHPHPDHMADLIPLLFALDMIPCWRPSPRHPAGPPGLGPLLEALNQAWSGWLNPPAEVLSRRWLAPGEGARIGGAPSHRAAAQHHPHSLAWRLEAGGAAWSIWATARPAGAGPLRRRGGPVDLPLRGHRPRAQAGPSLPAACGQLAPPPGGSPVAQPLLPDGGPRRGGGRGGEALPRGGVLRPGRPGPELTPGGPPLAGLVSNRARFPRDYRVFLP